ncbi:hypothetical protein BRD15_04655 [Halobacteriales archaeon SW_6_65_15]|nr:MAG: hypothetical protein BRD15_04655 [Halobacteriales archaeon SW_6_65_15]
MIVFVTGSESETTPKQRFERLLNLPPSSKLVYKVLEALLPARTTRDALTKLKDADLVEEQLYVPDARKRLYAPRSIADPEEVELPE